MKRVAGRMKSELAQFRELAAFAQFASDLDRTTRAQIDRGQRLTELLKQPQYAPVPLEDQVVSIFAGTNGLLDDVPVPQVRQFEREMLEYMHVQQSELMNRIADSKDLTRDDEDAVRKALEEFKSGTSYGQPATGRAAAAS
jgi:F-type H+-transporting ATPase subunit alpha